MISFFYAFNSQALAENSILPIDSEESILSQIKLIANGDMERFLEGMDILNKKFIGYISDQTPKCSAAVTIIEMTEEGEKIIKKKRVSKKEEKLCLFKLVQFKIKFTQVGFRGRKSYLSFTQRLQTNQLLEFEKNRIQELERLAKKYN
jgi:hypothetical protein